MDTIISSKNLAYGPVSIHPDLSISKGLTTFLSGPSGCGKTTLTRLINATLSPDHGELFYNGIAYNDLDVLDLRKEIILASQNVYLFSQTIEENFELFHKYRDSTPPTKEEISAYLELSCANFPLDSNCEILSGGERQRIYIAICLSFMPKVLMLDEPTSALDNKTANKLLTNLKEFAKNKGITQIIVSHDLSLVKEFGDKIISCFQEVSYE